MMGMQYTICCWAINRSDPQNLLSVTLDVPLQGGIEERSSWLAVVVMLVIVVIVVIVVLSKEEREEKLSDS